MMHQRLGFFGNIKARCDQRKFEREIATKIATEVDAPMAATTSPQTAT